MCIIIIIILLYNLQNNERDNKQVKIIHTRGLQGKHTGQGAFLGGQGGGQGGKGG